MHTLLQKLPLPDADVWYAPSFFTPAQSELYFTQLQQQVAWKQEKIKMFGKEVLLPRLTAWYGDKSYSYSGLKNEPQPWLPILEQLKTQVEQATNYSYNSVLLNLYPHGQSGMGWHSDDEPELGPEPTIASVSFGAIRKFGFKHRYNKTQPTIYFPLASGSLLLMQGATQHNWLHSITKTARPTDSRINLTFRNILS